MNHVLKIAFHTSLLSYTIFLLADYVRPGFVSYTFSVHWFLLAVIVFGALWAWVGGEAVKEGFLGAVWRWAWQLAFGIIIALLVWQHGDAFGDLRIFVTLVGFFTPWIILKYLSYER